MRLVPSAQRTAVNHGASWAGACTERRPSAARVGVGRGADVVTAGQEVDTRYV